MGGYEVSLGEARRHRRFSATDAPDAPDAPPVLKWQHRYQQHIVSTLFPVFLPILPMLLIYREIIILCIL